MPKYFLAEYHKQSTDLTAVPSGKWKGTQWEHSLWSSGSQQSSPKCWQKQSSPFLQSLPDHLESCKTQMEKRETLGGFSGDNRWNWSEVPFSCGFALCYLRRKWLTMGSGPKDLQSKTSTSANLEVLWSIFRLKIGWIGHQEVRKCGKKCWEESETV